MKRLRYFFRIQMPAGPDPVIFVRTRDPLFSAWPTAERYARVAFPRRVTVHYERLETDD